MPSNVSIYGTINVTTGEDTLGGWRAVAVSMTATYTDDRPLPRPTPDGWTDLGELLTRLAPRCEREAVVLLAEDTARYLSLPVDPAVLPVDRHGRRVGGGIEHPAQLDAQRAGWTASNIGDWSTFSRDGGPGGGRQRIRVAIDPLLDKKTDAHGRYYRTPVYAPPRLGGLGTVVDVCSAWHRLTGSAYHGTAGMAGMSVMSACWPERDQKTGRKPPTWKPKIVGPDDAVEYDYTASHWRASAGGMRYVHGYDANRAYIAAAMLVEVCPWGLKHTGRTEWTPRLAGWWKVELAPWVDNRLPNPAGYMPDQGREMVRWISGPTMCLLHELTEKGIYGGVRVLDSWTGPARDWVLRPWAERMRDAYQLLDPAGKAVQLDAPVVEAVRWALKCAGRETLGLLDRQTNWAYRPDWWYAVVALARANLFRKMLKTGYPSDGRPARWPVSVDVDNVYYPSDEPDPVAAAPGYFPLDLSGIKLGHFKPKKTLTLEVRSGRS